MRYIENYNLFELTNYLTDKQLGLCVLNGKLEAFCLLKNHVVNLVEDVTVKSDPDLLSRAIQPMKSASKNIVPPKSRVFPKRKMPAIAKIDGTKTGKRIHAFLESGLSPHCPQRGRSNSSTDCNCVHKKPARGRATSLGDLSEPSSRKLLIDLISTLDDFFPDYNFDTTKPEQFLIKDVKQVIKSINGYLAELTEEKPDFLETLWGSIDDVINLKNCEAFSLVPDKTEDPFSDGTFWSFNYFLFNHDLKQLIYFTCVAKR